MIYTVFATGLVAVAPGPGQNAPPAAGAEDA
jgi:hypothetical protein